MILLLLLTFAMAVAAILTSCGSEELTGDNVYQVYTVSSSSTKVESHAVELTATNAEGQVAELMTALAEQPAKLEYQAPLQMGFTVLDWELVDERLSLNVDEAYKKLPATTEVLVRAALVRTFCQLDGVRYVGITVDGEALYDNVGEQITWMNADQFIDNDGSEINTYEEVRVKLYFANEAGDGLIAAYREKYYSTNTPLERFVVDELISGPSGQVEGLYASINPETKVNSVLTKDGICYVNLDSKFLTVVNNVPTELSIYSIVNSLSELSGITKVQILIDGEVPSSFSSTAYERNLDCVTTLE